MLLQYNWAEDAESFVMLMAVRCFCVRGAVSSMGWGCRLLVEVPFKPLSVVQPDNITIVEGHLVDKNL